MNNACKTFTTGHPLHKFYPPSLDPKHLLLREKLITTLLSSVAQHHLIFIEAQAGHGKSTLAAQMLARLKSTPFGWYQIGTEDGDPVLFLGNLLTCLMQSLPGFSSPILDDMLRKGEIDAFETVRHLNILLADLARHITKDYFLVFDDLHLLEEFPLSQAFLARFIDSAPRRIHFVLLSRRPSLLGSELELLRKEAPVIGHEMLMLSESEIFTLFNDILVIPISRSRADELHRLSEGWIMGLTLAGLEISRDSQEKFRSDAFAILQKSNAGSLADYFRDEVFPRLEVKTRVTLCRISLLSTVPLSLAERLTGSKEIATLLNYLVDKNYFVRRMNAEGTEFAFHHLFQEALRLVANDELSPEEQCEVLKTAGDYFLALKSPEEALIYFQRAGDQQAIEEVLGRDGIELFAMNRLAMIESVLSGLTDGEVELFAWIPLFKGLILLRTNPPDALRYLELAKTNFEAAHNEIGRVLTLAQLIYFHTFMDCRFDVGADLLTEAETAFIATFDQLHLHSRIQVALYLSTGYSYFRGDMSKAGYHSAMALRLSEEYGLENFRGLAIFNRAFEAAFIGKWPAFRRELEKAYLLQTNPKLNHVTQLMLTVLPFNYFLVIGDGDAIHRELAFMKAKLGDVVDKSIVKPICILFEADARIGDGRLTEALGLIRTGMALGLAVESPHLKSQYLQYLAWIYALHGDREGALAAAGESSSLRAFAGGKPFDTVNKMILGGTYAQLGMAEEAEDHLERSIRLSLELEEECVRAGAYAHRASLRLRLGRIEQGLADLAECLRCMAENGYNHFFSWTPALMRPLLETAVSSGIHPEYARKLAFERLGVAILPGGISIPLLEIQALGGLSLSIADKSVVTEELTPSMRKLLALLLSAPGYKISQEEILLSLWPDVSETKSRSRFDTLLLELRKALKSSLAPHDPAHYLALKKGMLCLYYCRIDAEIFEEHARRGLEHVQDNEYWQAGNSFRSAMSLRKGTYLPGSRGEERVCAVAEKLDLLWFKGTLAWGKYLMDSSRTDECIEVLCQFVRNDLTSDDHATMLYHAYLRNNQPVLANAVLKRYEDALKVAEYYPEDIVEALKALRGKWEP